MIMGKGHRRDKIISMIKGRTPPALFCLSLGGSQAFPHGPLPGPLPGSHAPCRQPASSLPSRQSRSWLHRLIARTQVPSPHWNSFSPQGPSAAERGQEVVRTHAAPGQLSPPPQVPSAPGKNEPVAELRRPQRTPTQNISSVHMGRLKLREGEGLAKGHTALQLPVSLSTTSAQT